MEDETEFMTPPPTSERLAINLGNAINNAEIRDAHDRFPPAIDVPAMLSLWVFPRGDDDREGGHPQPAYMLADTLVCLDQPVSKFTGVKVQFTDPIDRDEAERVARWFRLNGWKRAEAKADFERLEIGEAGA
jgi:hypothetical protein